MQAKLLDVWRKTSWLQEILMKKIIGLVSRTKETNDKRNYTAILDCPIDFRQLNNIIKQLFKS